MLGRQTSFLRALLTAALWAVACLALPVQAAPEMPSDALAQLLRDKGLAFESDVQTSAVQATRQVRDATSDLALSALAFLGVPYRRGGDSSETGLDCSGFTRLVFENSLGLLLPRRVDEQAHASGLQPVRRSELEPGDLVFFNTLKRTFSHVGIYLGEGKFIHAPKPGAEVRIESLDVRYWAKRFTGARRAPQIAGAAVSAAPAAVAEQNTTPP